MGDLIQMTKIPLMTLSSSDEEQTQIISSNLLSAPEDKTKMKQGGEEPTEELKSMESEGHGGESLKVLQAGVEENVENMQRNEATAAIEKFDDWLDEILFSPHDQTMNEKKSMDDNQAVDVILSGSVASLKIEESEEDFIHVEENIPAALKIKNELNALIGEIAERKLISKKNRDLKQRIVKRRLMDGFERVKDLSEATLLILSEEVVEYRRVILASGKVWLPVKRLLELFDPDTANNLAFEPLNAREEARKLYVDYLVSPIERKIKKATAKLRKLEDVDVDLADENNSAFVNSEDLLQKCAEWFDTICKLRGESNSADLSAGKTINLLEENAGTGVEAVDLELERFLNRNKHKGCPDFADLYKIIEENMSNNSGDEESHSSNFTLAKRVFQNVDKIFRKRRRADFELTLNHHIGNETEFEENFFDFIGTADPAESDPDLKAKLAQNLAMRKSEVEVMNRFVETERVEQEKKRIACLKRKRIQETGQSYPASCELMKGQSDEKQNKKIKM